MEELKEQKPYLSWDLPEIFEARVKDRMEDQPHRSKTEIIEEVMGDEWIMAEEWASLCDSLTEAMKEINPHEKAWFASMTGFGWRNLSGHKSFEASAGRDFLQKILPTCDYKFKLWVDKKKKTIKLNVVHHDSPIWGKEWYYVRLLEDQKDTLTSHKSSKSARKRFAALKVQSATSGLP